MSEEKLLYSHDSDSPEDKLHTGLAILSFCLPIAGGIIYFVYKSNRPNAAKSACHAALWGFGLNILINLLVGLSG